MTSPERPDGPPKVTGAARYAASLPPGRDQRDAANSVVNFLGARDPQKAIAFFGQTQGWSPDEVRQQVLTPIEESSIRGTAHADPNSIMCYQIPGTITKDGKPIIGGKDIDASDFQFVAQIYPKGAKAPAKAPARRRAARAGRG